MRAPCLSSRAIPKRTPVAFQARWLGTRIGTLSKPVQASGCCPQGPASAEHLAARQLRRVPLTTEVAAGAIFGAARGGGVSFWDGSLRQGKSHTETGPAPLPSPAVTQRGHPGPQKPRHRATHPQPRARQIFPELLRSRFARYQPLPCLLLRGPSHPPLSPGGAASALEGVPGK